MTGIPSSKTSGNRVDIASDASFVKCIPHVQTRVASLLSQQKAMFITVRLKDACKMRACVTLKHFEMFKQYRCLHILLT